MNEFNMDAEISLFLTNETKKNQNSNWNRLDKTTKLTRLREYLNGWTASNEEIERMLKYLCDRIDRKRLNNLRDVQYDNMSRKVIRVFDITYNEMQNCFIINTIPTKAMPTKAKQTKAMPIKAMPTKAMPTKAKTCK